MSTAEPEMWGAGGEYGAGYGGACMWPSGCVCMRLPIEWIETQSDRCRLLPSHRHPGLTPPVFQHCPAEMAPLPFQERILLPRPWQSAEAKNDDSDNDDVSGRCRRCLASDLLEDDACEVLP